MIVHQIVDINEDINNSISKALEYLCKENNINYKNQEYKVLFSNEKLFLNHNDIVFTSGSKKYLSFYGKVYTNKNKTITETVHLENDKVIINPHENSLLIIRGGVGNSTKVEEDQEILYFYIAPKYFLKLHDGLSWQTL
jgi:hypothetical protein